MPSLRRSLIVYFLVLVGLALGGLGLLIDRFASDFSAARLRSETARIDQENADEQRKIRDRFDADLLAEAKLLAKEYRDRMWSITRLDGRKVSDQFNVGLFLYPLCSGGNASGVMTSVAVGNPTGATRWLWWGQFYTNVARELSDKTRSEFQVSGEHPDYFQLHVSARDPKDRQVIRSPKQPFDLPVSFDAIRNPDAVDHAFDDVTIPGVGTVRRVMYRASYTLPNIPRPFGPFGGGGQPPGRPDRPRPGDPPRPAPPPAPQPGAQPNPGPPPLVVQCAQPKAELDARLAAAELKRDERFDTLTAENRDGLNRLRLRVAVIAGVTFLAVVLGGWLLTGVGLLPLRKLSDAVSQVNEKDFRLPIDRTELTTELVPIHDRLTHSLDALRRAFEREKDAVADISHELRTPVAGMLATLDVALRKPRTAEQYKETLTECRVIAKQLGGLVEKVMTLAYLDAGHAEAQPLPTDAAELARGCAAVIRPLAQAQGLTLVTDLDDEAEVTTDPDKLREVVINLLHNAVEYNRPGGSVTLSVRRNGVGTVIEVADTGIGMTDEVRGKIFDRFFRADPSRTATGAHAGLGLAIVKEYVGRLGGAIGVDSTPDVGSTFRVTLPG